MLLTIFLAIVFSAAITLIQRDEELFYGAKIMGWGLMIFSMLLILGVGVIAKQLDSTIPLMYTECTIAEEIRDDINS